MRIYIDSSLLNDEQHFRNLDKLLIMIEDGKHTLLLHDDEDTIMESKWLESQGARIKDSTTKLIEKVLIASVHDVNPGQATSIAVNSKQDDVNNLENALKKLEDPLIILVENATSDGAFIDCLSRCFSQHSGRIRAAFAKGWLEYFHAGGINQIVPAIERYCKRKTAPYEPRIFVLVDSNKLNPTDQRQEVTSITDYCSERNIPCRVLYKREIENYLPWPVLGHCFEDDDQTFASVIKLSADQMDFFDFDEGFKNKSTYHPDQEQLFDGFHEDDFNALRRGISISKAHLYPLFSDGKVNQVELLKRCSHQPEPLELRNILVEIDSHL